MTPPVQWLSGRHALIAGEGDVARVVGEALREAGAQLHFSAVRAGSEAEIPAEMGGVDILVHGGVSGRKESADEIGLEAWRQSVSADIDLRFLQSAEFAHRCVAAGRAGVILFLLPSAEPRAGHAGSATVIGAIDNLVKSLAVEWARDGIRVNAIASRACEPGGLEDGAVRASLGHLAAYLVSDYGAYISGMVMGIDET